MAERQPITLVFGGLDGRTVEKGPYGTFCLQGESLRDRVNGSVIAAHEDHHWRLDGQNFTRVDCDCRVAVTALRVDGRHSERMGPFDSFSCTDGIAYADHELFAVADQSIGDWYCHGDGLHWSMLVVEAAE
jgi:hypothetical protein